MPNHFYGSHSHAYNPYTDEPSEEEDTSALAVRERAIELGINVDHKTKHQLVKALHRRGVVSPQMSDEDAECASRFGNLTKDEVVNSAVMLGLVKPSSTKIDACKALHDAGIQTEDHLVVVMNDMKPLESQNQLPQMVEWQCENPTSAPARGSCKLASAGGSVAPGFAGRVYDNEISCNNKCVKSDMGSRKANDYINALEHRLNPKSAEQKAREVMEAQQHKKEMDDFTFDKLGKKCRRSKVGKHILMRDKKGRFCKKSSKRRARK